MARTLLALWLLLAAVTDAVPLFKRVTPPQSDPFYVPPAGYQSKPNGAVIKSRKITPIFPLVTGWQVLYRTTGANTNTPLATVTTILIPPNAVPGRVVHFATAEDSSWIGCAPSYAYQAGAQSSSIIAQFESLIIELLLAQGYIVTSSDYEGPNAAFGAGPLAGHGVLDAIRATLAFKQINLPKTTKVIGVGYSGGAIATGWAAALQPTYAPELPILAWSAGGTPANISATVQYIDGGLFAGFGPAGVAGLSTAYPALPPFIARAATPAGKAALAKVSSQCVGDDLAQFAFQKLQSTNFNIYGDKLLFQPVVQSVTKQLNLGSNKAFTPRKPMLIYHAQFDEIIPIGPTDQMVNSWCSNGATIRYVREIGVAEHASLEILFLPAVFAWIADRFNGAPLGFTGCQIEQTTTALYTAGALGVPLLATLTNLLGILTGQIGLDDSIWKASIKAAAAKRFG